MLRSKPAANAGVRDQMNAPSLVCDSLELGAVFLLAVEAIKLENLARFREGSGGLYRRLNPNIEFVDDFASDASVFERRWFEIYLGVIYMLGVASVFLLRNTFVWAYLPSAPAGWLGSLLTIVGYVITPIFLGFAVYLVALGALKSSVGVLGLIERHTHSGIIGILGFAMFTLQFIARRALDL
nr:hypothetical protein [uncultured Halomonas sp.]